MDTTTLEILIICFVIQPLATVIHTKLYRNTKRETHQENGKVVQSIIKHYSIVQLISWPFMTLYIVVLYIGNDKLEIIPEPIAISLIHILRFFYGSIRDYLSFNSLIIAVTRYTFLVFAARIESVGIKRLRTFFIYSSFLVPICNACLYVITQPIEQYWISILPTKSSISNDTSTNISYHPFTKVNMNERYESTIYLWINQNLPASFIQIMSNTVAIVLIIIYSNVIEGFLYAHAILLYRR